LLSLSSGDVGQKKRPGTGHDRDAVKPFLRRHCLLKAARVIVGTESWYRAVAIDRWIKRYSDEEFRQCVSAYVAMQN
jgi:hypothetical protein